MCTAILVTQLHIPCSLITAQPCLSHLLNNSMHTESLSMLWHKQCDEPSNPAATCYSLAAHELAEKRDQSRSTAGAANSCTHEPNECFFLCMSSINELDQRGFRLHNALPPKFRSSMQENSTALTTATPCNALNG